MSLAPAPIDGEPAAPPDRAEARDRLPAGNPERRVGVPDAGPVERVADDGDLVVADEHLVDERRADDAVPVERQVAERRRRHAAEQQRNGALVVPGLVFGDREASEDLVLRRRVPVDAPVALVGADRRQRFTDEIPGDAAAHGPVRQRVERGVGQDRRGRSG